TTVGPEARTALSSTDDRHNGAGSPPWRDSAGKFDTEIAFPEISTTSAAQPGAGPASFWPSDHSRASANHPRAISARLLPRYDSRHGQGRFVLQAQGGDVRRGVSGVLAVGSPRRRREAVRHSPIRPVAYLAVRV